MVSNFQRTSSKQALAISPVLNQSLQSQFGCPQVGDALRVAREKVWFIFGRIFATKSELVSGRHGFSMALIPCPSRRHNVVQ